MKKIIRLISSRTLWITILSFSAFAVPASVYSFIWRKTGVAPEPHDLINGLIFLVAIAINLLVAGKFFSFQEVGVQRKGFFRSFFYSFFFVFVYRLVSALASGETFTGGLGDPKRYLLLIVLVFSAFHEELLFRGIILRVWEKSRGFIAAMFVSTLLFGVEHLVYPSWGFGDFSLSTALSAATFSPVFMLVAYRTRNIWGLSLSHFLYNASTLFGSNSGTTDSPDSYFFIRLGFIFFLPMMIDSIDRRIFRTEQPKIDWHRFFSWLFIVLFVTMLADSVLEDLGWL